MFTTILWKNRCHIQTRDFMSLPYCPNKCTEVFSLWVLTPFSSVQLLSRVQLCDPMKGSTPGLPVHHQLPEFTQTHVHWVGDAIQQLILCCPLLLLPSIFASIRVFSNESALRIRWPKYCSFSFTSVLPMNTQDWFPLGWTGWISLQSKGLFKSLLQHHSSKASILLCSAFFIVQLSQSYITFSLTSLKMPLRKLACPGSVVLKL